MNLPAESTKLTNRAVAHRALACASTNDIAFRELCRDAYAYMLQAPLPEMNNDMQNIPTGYNAITPDQRRLFALWDIIIPEDWERVPNSNVNAIYIWRTTDVETVNCL